MKGSARTKTLLNTWLQTGSQDALDDLVKEFSASYQASGGDAPGAFRGFLQQLRSSEEASSRDTDEHDVTEPIYDFTGYVGPD